MEYLTMLQMLTSQQQAIFYAEMGLRHKSFAVAFLLCFFLGGLGAHKFYLNKKLVACLFLLFSWTIIPAIIALIELFFISSAVKKVNTSIAFELIANMQREPAAA